MNKIEETVNTSVIDNESKQQPTYFHAPVQPSLEYDTKAKRLALIAQQGVVCDLQWLIVTPEIATNFLLLNRGNRDYAPEVAGKYAMDMERNEWGQCTEAIAFTPDGYMIQGQHRCGSIILTGIPQKFCIMMNVVPYANMDTGAKRTAYDFIKLARAGDPVTQSKKVISVVREMTRRKLMSNRVPPTNADILRVFERYNKELAQMCSICKGKQGPAIMKAALLAAFINGENYGKICNFYNIYSNGFAQNNSEQSIVFLSNFHAQLRQCANGTRTNDTALQRTIFCSTQYAFFEYINNGIITQFSTDPNSYNVIWDYKLDWLNYDASGREIQQKYRPD